MAVLADKLGFESVWTAEHHFVDDGYLPSLLVFNAAIAARTSDIRIGTGVLLAPLYDPVRLAEDAATLDLLSAGRVILGLGIGYHRVEYQGLRRDWSRRGVAMAETLQILRRAWSGQSIEFRGDVYQLPPVHVRPLPAQEIPIWVGGHAGAAIRRAARYASGFFSNASPQEFPRQVAVATEELRRLGRNEGLFAWAYGLRALYPCDDVRRGWREVLPYLSYAKFKFDDMEASAFRPGPDRRQAPERVRLENLRREAFVGTSQEIVERIAQLREAAGVPVHLVAVSYFPGMPHSQQEELLHRIAEEVVPALN